MSFSARTSSVRPSLSLPLATSNFVRLHSVSNAVNFPIPLIWFLQLEAALTIAIRNLHSDVYEWWCANHKTGSPVPTAAYLKGCSPRIRRVAQAVDEADWLVNEAVYGKLKRGRSTAKCSPLPPKAPPGVIPQTPFEQLKRNFQGNPPVPPMATGISAQSGRSDMKTRRSLRNKGSAGDS